MAKKKTIEAAQAPNAQKQHVIDVAIRCFEQYGPQRTTMADIAEESGLSRKTLYRWFEDRSSLVEQVLTRLFSEISSDVFAHIAKYDDAREAIVEGTIFSVENALESQLFNQIIFKDNNHRTVQLLFRGNSYIFEKSLEFWGPIFQKGKEQGQIRASLSDQRILELLLTCHSTLFLRPEFDQADRRRFLYDLLWSAITNQTDYCDMYEPV